MVDAFLASVFLKESIAIIIFLKSILLLIDPIFFGAIVFYMGYMMTQKAKSVKKTSVEKARFLTLLSSMFFGIGLALITGFYNLIPISAIGIAIALGTEMLKAYEILDFNVPIKAVRDAFKGVNDKYNSKDETEKDGENKEENPPQD